MKHKQVSKYKRLWEIIGIISAILGIIVSLIALSDPLDKLLLCIKRKLVWTKVALIYFYISTITTILMLVYLWNFKFLSYFRQYYCEKRKLFFLKLISSLIIPFILGLPLPLIISRVWFSSREGEILFKTSPPCPILIRTYANNGEVNYSLHEETPQRGPDGYAKVTFKTFGRNEEQNCGWVIFLLKGYPLNNYKEIRFLIRGERGGEKIGIKAKDARGIEVYLMLDKHYLRDGRITNDWQQVILPFADFGNVNFDLMDNFCIFSNGPLSGTRPQTIYMGDFDFR